MKTQLGPPQFVVDSTELISMNKIFSKPIGESWRSKGFDPKQLINSFIPQEMKIYYYILNVKQIFAIKSKFIKQ